MLAKEYEIKLVELLALIYNKIDWKKMRTNKRYADIFNHRVRAAARRATLYEFTSKLCNYFGLQSLPESAQEILDQLREQETDVLNTLNKEHVPLCVRAIIRAKELRKAATQQQTIVDLLNTLNNGDDSKGGVSC